MDRIYKIMCSNYILYYWYLNSTEPSIDEMPEPKLVRPPPSAIQAFDISGLPEITQLSSWPIASTKSTPSPEARAITQQEILVGNGSVISLKNRLPPISKLPFLISRATSRVSPIGECPLYTYLSESRQSVSVPSTHISQSLANQWVSPLHISLRVSPIGESPLYTYLSESRQSVSLPSIHISQSLANRWVSPLYIVLSLRSKP